MRIRTTVKSPASAPSAEDSEHVDLASPCTSHESGCFKENINLNKSETPKLCLEPLQMKRKKNGGCNLRKSLAWDKAFFSEEGVLDPVELSVISGTPCREGFPFINGKSPGSPQLSIKPLDSKKLEKNGQMVLSSPKIDSSSSKTRTATYLTSDKFPTPLGNKSGSRFGDCPRPVPPSSLKRPANANVGKAAGKDLKLPKVPGLKLSLSPVCSTTKNTILKTNCVKRNQITKPDFNIQRNPGSKSFPKSPQNKSASKASSLRPVCYPDGNSVNPSSKRLSSVNMSPVLVDNTNNSGSKRISDIMTPSRPVNSSEAQQKSAPFTVPLSRNAHVSGMIMHPSQNHPRKPSGLRMPSPSLSFFSEPRQLVFHELPLSDKEADVCASQKPENSTLLDKLRTPKIDQMTTASAINSSKAISSRSECMPSSHVSAVEVIKPNMDREHMHVKILDISKNRSGRITCEEAKLQKIDIELPSESGSGEKVMDDKFLRKAAEGYREEACIPYCHKPHRKQTYLTKDSLGEADKDKNVLSAEERASEHLEKTQLNGSCFRGNEGTIESLEHRQTKAENSGFASNHQHANLPNGTGFTEVPTDTHLGNVPMENTVFALSIGDCRNDADLTSKVDDATSQSGKEMDSPRNAESNTSDTFLPEKQSCLQNSQYEKNVEKLISVVPDRKDGEKVDTKTAISLSPDNIHDCNFVEDKMIRQLPVNAEFNFVDDSLSSESHCSLLDVSFNRDFKSKANYLSNNLANKNLSSSLHQGTEIDYCSSFPENKTSAIMNDGSADDQLTSNMALKESESGVDNRTCLLDSGSVVVQSSESNVLNECCADDTELLTLPSGEFVVENVGDHNHQLHFENSEGTEGPVTGQSELYPSISRSTSFSAKETPLRDENSNGACGIMDYTADLTPDLFRVEPSSESSESEVSEVSNSSFISLHAKAEATVTPNKENGDCVNDKSGLCVLPSNAIPFSDEWLTAIEAAGEDILTKKSGPVQNSPPDKTLPEPGPYSPVKRKNNQIGPFDCTKFTTVVLSDPN